MERLEIVSDRTHKRRTGLGVYICIVYHALHILCSLVAYTNA